jgi:hypothetical protein
VQANQQPVRLENWRRTFLEVIERQKAKDAGSKGKDKEVAEPLSPSDERPVAPPGIAARHNTHTTTRHTYTTHGT